jgi:acyl-CoA synthetase (NDP forming)
MSRSLTSVFTPARVAVVGASDTPGSPGSVLWRNLGTFPGEVVPVSRSASEVGGVPAYGSLRDVPGTIDLAVLAVPAAATLEVLRDAVAAGVGACIVVSAGFAETGPVGRALQDELVRVAREGGVLLVGPNCLGVQNWDVPLNASLAAGAATGGGGIAVITQSGSYAMALSALSADEGVAFSTAYSCGNRADIDDAEVLDHLRTDPGTEVVCAFVESFADGRTFLDAAERLTATKPLVVTAVGRSTDGARAAASHTAALASDRRAWDDVLRNAGATVTRSGLEMLDAARALRGQPLPRGVRVGIVTNSGGTGTELSDLLADEGLTVPALSDGLRAELAALLPAYASAANPVDITPVWSRFAELYPVVIEALARSGEVDVVIPVLLHRSAEDPTVAQAVADSVARLRVEGNDVPVHVCWVARRSAWPITATLQAAGIPSYEWPPRTARALGHASRYAAFRRAAAPEPASREDVAPRPIPHDVAADPLAAHSLLTRFGIEIVDTRVALDAEEAVAVAAAFGLPVVLKVDHPSLSHKSDVGGVRLGLRDLESVRAAAADLLGLAPGARVLVQPQRSGVELVVGGLRDPTFGPLVLFGLGGVFVELLDDIGFARAPLSPEEAERLVSAPRGASLLTGARGTVVDRSAVVALVHAVGQVMAAHPEVEELDLNPVLAGPGGCVAVDVRLVMRRDDA